MWFESKTIATWLRRLSHATCIRTHVRCYRCTDIFRCMLISSMSASCASAKPSHPRSHTSANHQTPTHLSAIAGILTNGTSPVPLILPHFWSALPSQTYVPGAEFTQTPRHKINPELFRNFSATKRWLYSASPHWPTFKILYQAVFEVQPIPQALLHWKFASSGKPGGGTSKTRPARISRDLITSQTICPQNCIYRQHF